MAICPHVDEEIREEASQYGEIVTVKQQEIELFRGDTGLGFPQHCRLRLVCPEIQLYDWVPQDPGDLLPSSASFNSLPAKRQHNNKEMRNLTNVPILEMKKKGSRNIRSQSMCHGGTGFQMLALP